jgi:hypothetical protein
MRVMSARLRSIAFALTAAITLAPSLAASGQESGVLTGQDLLFGGYYSAEWQSRDDIVAMVDATGKKVTFSGTFHNAAQEPAWITDWILEQSWEAESTPFANVNVPASARSVAAGLYDEDIERWVSQVKAWLDRGEGRSLFVAPFQEMNGTWTPYGGDPANFKIAYRKVVDAFRNAGIDETQVRFVFAPNSFSTRPYRIAHYYPGGTLVDVVGMSAYNMGPTLDRWISVRETMDAGLAELRQVAPRKPIIIAQVGSSPIEGDQVSWLWEMFTFLTRDPHVIGFVYFNFNKETDWRVWTGISLSDGWRIGMNLPTTLHVWPLTDWFRPGPLPFTVDGSAPSGWFIDDDDSEFAADIAWLVERRITRGCDAPVEDRYCPEDPVSRAQMASFLARAFDLPPAEGDRFTDDSTSTHQDDINRIAQAGISMGCGDNQFCPDATVDRAQMAAFLARALDLPPTSVDFFTDDDGSLHESAINSVAAHGITIGCGRTEYCPDTLVTRGQMAALLRRAVLNAEQDAPVTLSP